MLNKLLNAFFVILLFFSISILAEGKKETLNINDVLVLGPIESKVPAFGDEVKFYSELVKFESIDITDLMPAENDLFHLEKNTTLKWTKKNIEELEFSGKGNTIYLAVYVSADRFVKAKLNIKSANLINVYYDGFSIETKTEEGKKELSKELLIENGKHIILLKVINASQENGDWETEMSLSMSEPFTKENIKLSVSPERATAIKELLDNPKLGNVSISADGMTAAVQISKRTKAKDKDEKWFELYNVKDGKIIKTYRGGMSVNQISWSPAENKFAYTTVSGDKTTIWIVDLNNNSNIPLLTDINNFIGFQWSPDGSFLIYTASEKSNKRENDLFKYEKVQDRWPEANDKNYLYKVDLPEGIVTKLTGGDVSSDLVAISPDGKKIIFTQIEFGVKERPYQNIKDYILDLETMKYELMLEGNFLGNVYFSPDGQKLLVEGGSSLFNNLGVNVNDGVLPSDFDTQAYIYDLRTKEAEPITKNFDPEINSSFWVNDSTIYFKTTAKSFSHLYKYDITKKSFSLINLESEVLHQISFSDNGDNAVFTSSSSNVPKKAFTINLSSGSLKLLSFPEEVEYSKIKLGEVNDWDFISEAGRTVQGRVYYPPFFDSNKTYPAIVYYYGGTSPVERNFEGRYPFNIYTANGYVVYVLQPTGANGYGQNNSAVNVNDWGKVTAAEVIEGTKKFIEAHKFIDSQKVGCMGASYGGFLTQNVITKTDIFSAAISHAGISILTSYWGEGYWGMWFNAVAAANSFPWNRKDIYVDHSPIYNADKITTPLLLLHGNIDPNVPLGESWTMYTALKILGKDVELIEINKQEHWVMEYNKRTKWTKTILAYFDKYLKNQPEWWNELYK
ncbi:MAG: S9 family peptidase [Bacteroidetes bacterium]|nr:S9 family peptidase [Bacteroidota bacterium]